MASTITHEQLTAMLRYDELTGEFTWLVQASSRANVGSIAGCVDKRDGYVVIRLLGRLYLAHRLAWFYVTGAWPEKQIDHERGERGDNRFAKLRDVSNAVNQQNLRRAKSSNKTGLLGVSLERRSGMYCAFITPAGGKTKRLGRFPTPEQAHAAYIAAKRQLHQGNTL